MAEPTDPDPTDPEPSTALLERPDDEPFFDLLSRRSSTIKDGFD